MTDTSPHRRPCDYTAKPYTFGTQADIEWVEATFDNLFFLGVGDFSPP